MFFHDLQCRSGFGDRLLDLWAAAAIARLHEPAAPMSVCWHPGLDYLGFTGTYASKLFSMERCEFAKRPPSDARPVAEGFSDVALNDEGIASLASGARQVILRGGANWGTNCPEQLHDDASFYGLDSSVTLDEIVASYREQARRMAPSASIERAIPEDIGQRVGVHVRLWDKLVDEENSFEMSSETWRAIELSASLYIERCIDRGEPLFVCSDDIQYRDALVADIRAKGGDAAVVTARPRLRRPEGFDALADFFALSRCARVVQMTKYSTFSIAAALVGGLPLVNFFEDDRGTGHRLELWQRTLGEVSAA
ncbi:MAG: hypothetical protein ACR2OD_07740 [Gaiellaceae bacterium]